ncbi:MAG: Import inner membrane translocase subunit Tim44 [Candidatus Tokpelaia sp. JSC188]|nr:MAG: Import inner membrane translocase subunit Tim44 [Candidatus Tokpelaia sp. JSC188]
MDLNIITLVFFVLAVVVFIQLRNVLGRRTGNEHTPFDPYAKPAQTNQENDEAAVTFPQRGHPSIDDFSDIDSLAPSDSALNSALRAIRKADFTFSPVRFRDGAKTAYEMILTAFAKGNREVLKNLLVKNIYEEFAQAIDEREANGHSIRFSLVSINDAEIIEAIMQKNEAYITMRLSSEIISATYDKENKLLDGNPQSIVTIRDRWTFVRDTHTRDPNWRLVTTEEDE